MNGVSAQELAVDAGMALCAVQIVWADHLSDEDAEALDRARLICGRLSDQEDE